MSIDAPILSVDADQGRTSASGVLMSCTGRITGIRFSPALSARLLALIQLRALSRSRQNVSYHHLETCTDHATVEKSEDLLHRFVDNVSAGPGPDSRDRVCANYLVLL